MASARLKPREQGDLGELSAMEWFSSQGATIAVPIFSSRDWDLIAEWGGDVFRIQVKTSTQNHGDGRWAVMISTRGGNQSWNGVVKYFDPSRCDFLFVHVGDGRRWFIPSWALDCKSGLTVGGSKYSEFEIEPGRPLTAKPSLKSVSASGEYRSGQPGRPVKALAQPSQVRILPPPSPSRAPRSDEAHPDSSSGLVLASHTRVSANHQVTVPSRAFETAQLRCGDRMRVYPIGPGRVLLERIESPEGEVLGEA
jgi:PD-(D/E)XK endonuclease